MPPVGQSGQDVAYEILAGGDVIDELAARAAARSARVGVFPEYSSYFIHPFDDSLAAHAE